MEWKLMRLADCCTIKPSKSEAREKLNSSDLVSFVPMSNLGTDAPTIELSDTREFSEVSGSYTYFADGDVLLAKITPCFENGKLGIAAGLENGIGFGSSEFVVLRPQSLVDTKYLYYFLSQPSFRDAGERVMSGAVGHKRVPKDFIENTKIPLPSVQEQKRIVAMLDEAFADIDKARELAEQNLKNTRELFESYLHHQLTPHNDWCVSTLGEVSEISYGYTDSASYEVLGPKFLRITDIKGGSVDWDSVPLCQISSEDYNKHKLKSGDIVFARTGATTGKSYLVENPPEAVAASYLIRVRLDQERVNPRYVRYFFETRNYWDSVNAGTSGSAQGGFNASKLANLEIYFPTELDTQDVLIEKLEIISRMIEDVNKVYLEKLKNLNELKSGLFSKVFSRG